MDLKGISAIRLNKTELFHVFFIYQEIFIRKFVLVKWQRCLKVSITLILSRIETLMDNKLSFKNVILNPFEL